MQIGDAIKNAFKSLVDSVSDRYESEVTYLKENTKVASIVLEKIQAGGIYG